AACARHLRVFFLLACFTTHLAGGASGKICLPSQPGPAQLRLARGREPGGRGPRDLGGATGQVRAVGGFIMYFRGRCRSLSENLTRK
ncbi:hypothetical protein QBC46DRAFT_399795, partial [Diplogelasinospora grovesii]